MCIKSHPFWVVFLWLKNENPRRGRNGLSHSTGVFGGGLLVRLGVAVELLELLAVAEGLSGALVDPADLGPVPLASGHVAHLVGALLVGGGVMHHDLLDLGGQDLLAVDRGEGDALTRCSALAVVQLDGLRVLGVAGGLGGRRGGACRHGAP